MTPERLICTGSGFKLQRSARVEACVRTVGKSLHRTDKGDRGLPADSASACTSRARAPGFFGRMVQMNSNTPVRFVDESFQRCPQSLDGKLPGSAHPAAARNAPG